jgi:hypothetical protein
MVRKVQSRRVCGQEGVIVTRQPWLAANVSGACKAAGRKGCRDRLMWCMRWADRRGNGSKVSERTTGQTALCGGTHRGAPLLAKSCTVSSAERALSERGKRERRRSGIAQCDRERAGRSHSCVRSSERDSVLSQGARETDLTLRSGRT